MLPCKPVLVVHWSSRVTIYIWSYRWWVLTDRWPQIVWKYIFLTYTCLSCRLVIRVAWLYVSEKDHVQTPDLASCTPTSSFSSIIWMFHGTGSNRCSTLTIRGNRICYYQQITSFRISVKTKKETCWQNKLYHVCQVCTFFLKTYFLCIKKVQTWWPDFGKYSY